MCDGTLQFSNGEKPKKKVIMYLAESITAAEYWAEVIKAGVERFGAESKPAVVAENATGDMISRQAAIEACENNSYPVRYDFNYSSAEKGMTLTGIKQVLTELPPAEQRTGRWIPCEDRLPEEDKDVLICYQYKEGEGDTSHAYIDITSYGQAYFGGRKCSFKEWRAPFEYFHANYEVVAWMPLPEPYCPHCGAKMEGDNE